MSEIPKRRIAGIVLAAGLSSRMGGPNKLLEPVEGKPMARRAAEAALAGGLDPVIVVTGHEQTKVASVMGGLDTIMTHNAYYASGLAGSLAAGIAAVPNGCAGAAVLLGDMPWVAAEHVRRLAVAFDPDNGAAICVPIYRGKRGHPVLFAREFFPAIRRLTGDVGARQIVADNAARVREVAMDDAGVIADVDTPEALAAAR